MVAFALQWDRLYVSVTYVILRALFYSLLGGHLYGCEPATTLVYNLTTVPNFVLLRLC